MDIRKSTAKKVALIITRNGDTNQARKEVIKSSKLNLLM